MNKKPSIGISTRKNKLTTHTLYSEIYSSFNTEVKSLEKLSEVFPKLISNYFDSPEMSTTEKLMKLTKEELEEYKNFIEFWSERAQKHDSKKFNFNHTKVFQIFYEDMDNSLFKGRFDRFTRVNGLILLITEFEFFLKRILDLTFSIKPEAMISKNKQIDFENFIKKEKWESLNDVVDKELDEILSKDIQEIGIYLMKKFHLDLTKRSDWQNFCEIFYRRHLLIHNSGKIDKKYLEKIINNKISKEIEDHYKYTPHYLSVNQEYLRNSISLIKEYVKVIHDFFDDKYSKNPVNELVPKRHQISCAFLPEEHGDDEQCLKETINQQTNHMITTQ